MKAKEHTNQVLKMEPLQGEVHHPAFQSLSNVPGMQSLALSFQDPSHQPGSHSTTAHA